MSSGVGVRLDPSSSVRKAELFVALDASGRETHGAGTAGAQGRSAHGGPRQSGPGGTGQAGRAREEIRVYTASAVEREWLAELFPTLYRETDEVVFHSAKERVRAAKAKYVAQKQTA